MAQPPLNCPGAAVTCHLLKTVPRATPVQLETGLEAPFIPHGPSLGVARNGHLCAQRALWGNGEYQPVRPRTSPT